jgi:hypothetical protein
MMFPEDLGSCVLVWKNPSRTHGCKWSLLKVREREIQRGAWRGAGEICPKKESMLFFFRCF